MDDEIIEVAKKIDIDELLRWLGLFTEEKPPTH